MPATLPPLPYAFDALEPVIDAQTMQIHHGKHHQAYVTNLNAATAGKPDLDSKSAEELIKHLSAVPDDVRAPIRNNGGGHVNHSLFWTLLATLAARRRTHCAALADAIKPSFGSLADFQAQISRRPAPSSFGSGWAWLIVKDGKLVTTNASNPRTIRSCLLSGPHRRPPCGIRQADPRRGRVGTRVLSEVSEQTPGLSNGHLGCHQLGARGRTVRRGEVIPHPPMILWLTMKPRMTRSGAVFDGLAESGRLHTTSSAQLNQRGVVSGISTSPLIPRLIICRLWPQRSQFETAPGTAGCALAPRNTSAFPANRRLFRGRRR